MKYNKKRIVLLTNSEEDELQTIIKNNNKLCFEGLITLNEINKIKTLRPNEVIYPIEIRNEAIDEIFELKISGINIKSSRFFLQELDKKVDINSLSKDWLIKTEGFKILNSKINQKLKRFMDVVISITILLISAPLMLLIYFLVKLDDPKAFFKNPAFFKQERIGLSGVDFQIIKFRSMKIHDSSKYSKYADKNDNRITKIGKFLRKTRLDELPQIFNILKGEMSFVGPRPEWNELGRSYEKEINMYNLRYLIKPGLTGWAQVMYPYGSSLEDAKKKLEYDIYYIKYQNIILDIIILFKTVKVVLFRKGR